MKSFNELYEEIYIENYDEVEGKRKKAIYKFFTTIVITAIISIILVPKIIPSGDSGISIVFIIFIVIMIGGVKLAGGYIGKSDFEERITEKFIKNIDEKLNYYPNHGIASEKYNQGLFESYYKFYSKGYVEGKLEGKNQIELAEVRTTKKYINDNGREEEVTSFYGIFENIECNKCIETPVTIRTDKAEKGAIKKFLTMGPEERIRVETDSTEFEKYFDVFSTNPIIAMQILTADVMQLMVEFREQSNIDYELTIRQNKVYMRFHTIRSIWTKVVQKFIRLWQIKEVLWYDRIYI